MKAGNRAMSWNYPFDEAAGPSGLNPPINPNLGQMGPPTQIVPPTAPEQFSTRQTSKSPSPAPEGNGTSQEVCLKNLQRAAQLPDFKEARPYCPIEAAAEPSGATSSTPPPTPPSFPTESMAPTAPLEQNSQQASNSSSPEPEERADSQDGLKTVQHVAQLPAVQEALASAINVYSKVKKWNCISRLYFSTAEWILNKLLVPVPVSYCLRTPVRKADDLFLKSLLYIEEKLPILTLPSEQIVNKTKDSVNEKLRPCKNRIDALKDYGANKIKDGIQATLNSLPESLVPENICPEPIPVQPQQPEAAAVEPPRIPENPADTSDREPAEQQSQTHEDNLQKSTGAIKKVFSSKDVGLSEICKDDKEENVKLAKDPENNLSNPSELLQKPPF